jgi:hypothetical protein
LIRDDSASKGSSEREKIKIGTIADWEIKEIMTVQLSMKFHF